MPVAGTIIASAPPRVATGILLHGELIGFLQVRSDPAPIREGAQHRYMDHAVGGRPPHLEKACRGILTIEVEGQSKTVPHEDEIGEAATSSKEGVALPIEGVLGAPFGQVAVQGSIERDQGRRLAAQQLGLRAAPAAVGLAGTAKASSADWAGPHRFA